MEEETFKPDPHGAESTGGGGARESGDARRTGTTNRGGSQMGLDELASLARTAFDKKHSGDCLSLTRAILKVDPDHREALEIQSWVRSEQEDEIRRVRALLDDEKPWARYEVAQALLSGILAVDPDNEEANSLLPSVASQLSVSGARLPTRPLKQPAALPEPRPWISLSLLAVVAVVAVGAALGFADPLLERIGLRGVRDPVFQMLGIAGTRAEETALSSPGGEWLPPVTPGRVDLLVSPGSAVALRIDGGTFEPLSPEMDLEPGLHTFELRAIVPSSELTAPAAREPQETQQVGPAGTELSPDAVIPVTPNASPPIPTPAIEAPAPLGPPPVIDGRPLVTLQITARPWADVFLEGPSRLPLGRTPLSDLEVPVGSVLVFRSLGFVDRRHEVTATDEVIEITFP